MQPKPPANTYPDFSVDQLMNQPKQHFAATVYWPAQMAGARKLWGVPAGGSVDGMPVVDYAKKISEGWPTRKGSVRVDVAIMVELGGIDPLTEMQQRMLPNPPVFPNGLPWTPAGWQLPCTSPDEPMPDGAYPVTIDPMAYPTSPDLLVGQNPLGSLALAAPSGDREGPGALWWPGDGSPGGHGIDNGLQLLSLFRLQADQQTHSKAGAVLVGPAVFQKFSIVGAIGTTGTPSVLWLRLA